MSLVLIGLVTPVMMEFSASYVSLAYPMMTEADFLCCSIAFIVFAFACFLGYFWSTYVVPETANVSLEEIDAVFGSSAGQEDAELKREVCFPSPPLLFSWFDI